MRIGINATSFIDRPSGARQRFVGLYGALFRSRPEHHYLIYEPRDCRVAGWFTGLPNVTGIITPMPSDDRWQRWARGLGYWRRKLRRDRLDLFEALHLPLIRSPNCPTLLTVHDARPILSDVPMVRRAIYRQVLRRSLRDADAVITVSDTMRAELAAVEPRASITTIYNGIDPAPFEAAKGSGPAIVRGLGLPSDFLLAVGHFEPRKNYASLIEAILILRRTHPTVDLVIVGKDGGSLAEARALIERLGLSGQVRLLSSVDDRQLAGLYDAARLVVFPSTYEGFGIPLLEAMAAGCALCLSDIPVFRELTENRGAYFPPLAPPMIAASVAALLDSPDLRGELIAYGRRRVGDLAFDKLAAELDLLHQRLMSSASGGAAANAFAERPRRAMKGRRS